MSQHSVIEPASPPATAAAGIADTLDEAIGAVSTAVEKVTDTVDATVDHVQDTLSTTINEGQKLAGKLGQTFDLSAAVRSQPWLMIGGAVILGVVVGSMFCTSQDGLGGTTNTP